MQELTTAQTAAVDRAAAARTDGHALALFDDLDRDEGLRLHLAVADRLVRDGRDAIAGWKVGMTSGAARDLMGEGFRPFGFVLRSRTFTSGRPVTFRPGMPGAIEPEITLVLGTDLRGAVTPTEAAAAVRGVVPSFELLEQRVTANGPEAFGTKLLDGLSNWGTVLGRELPLEALQEVTTVHLHRDHELHSTTVQGEDVEIDDLFLSLARLSTLLGRFGVGLHAGQTVLTGAFVKTPATAPSSWRAGFSGIGEVEVDLA